MNTRNWLSSICFYEFFCNACAVDFKFKYQHEIFPDDHCTHIGCTAAQEFPPVPLWRPALGPMNVAVWEFGWNWLFTMKPPVDWLLQFLDCASAKRSRTNGLFFGGKESDIKNNCFTIPRILFVNISFCYWALFCIYVDPRFLYRFFMWTKRHQKMNLSRAKVVCFQPMRLSTCLLSKIFSYMYVSAM